MNRSSVSYQLARTVKLRKPTWCSANLMPQSNPFRPQSARKKGHLRTGHVGKALILQRSKGQLHALDLTGSPRDDDTRCRTKNKKIMRSSVLILGQWKARSYSERWRIKSRKTLHEWFVKLISMSHQLSVTSGNCNNRQRTRKNHRRKLQPSGKHTSSWFCILWSVPQNPIRYASRFHHHFTSLNNLTTVHIIFRVEAASRGLPVGEVEQRLKCHDTERGWAWIRDKWFTLVLWIFATQIICHCVTVFQQVRVR